ncbi:MAG: LptA/OstA family protein [Synergistaceae bacterium]|nr:LptA/OstA family protein [Synergistaceae bacterium]
MERKKIAIIILFLLSNLYFQIFPNVLYAREGFLQEDLAEDPHDISQEKILNSEIQKKLDADYNTEKKKNSSITEKQEITLDADVVTFDETNSIATATGNAAITDGSITITAEKVVYYTDLNLVEGYSPSGKQEVVLKDAKTELRGTHLRYDANLGRGELLTPHGSVDKMFFTAGTAIALKNTQAARQGYVAKSKLTRLNPNTSVSVWENAKMTSCEAELPHYHFETKQVVVVPGEKTVIKRPRLYYGKSLLFVSPFDMTIGRSKRKINPTVGYDSNLGVGVGLRGQLDFDDFGKLDLWGMAWFRSFSNLTPKFETKLRYTVDVFDGMKLYGQLNRLYNKRDDVIRWRPEYGLLFTKNGWNAHFRISKYELLSTRMRIGEEDVEHNLTRQPEFSLTTPDVNIGKLGKINLKAMWGSYQESDFGEEHSPWIERFGYGANFTSPTTWKFLIFSPYIGASFMRYNYSSYDEAQQVWNARIGLNYQIGAFLLNSSYQWRNVQGTSPMSWDRYEDNRNIFQSLAFKLPFGDANNKWFLALRGGYDSITNSLAEMRYVLTFIRHCMTFQLWCKEYYTNYDLKVGFVFFINAKPEHKLTFGGGDDGYYYSVPSSIDR